jgi:uncharacterized protein (TIGR00725 family)
MSLCEKPVIAVIGAGSCSGEVERLAEEVGEKIAESGAVLICGGLAGVMTAASRGARNAGGLTIGILPGNERSSANKYIDIAIATGIGEARNLIIIKSADVVIALPGAYGTLSEMAFTLKVGKPLVSLGDWEISDEVVRAGDAEEAVKKALELARKKV